MHMHVNILFLQATSSVRRTNPQCPNVAIVKLREKAFFLQNCQKVCLNKVRVHNVSENTGI